MNEGGGADRSTFVLLGCGMAGPLLIVAGFLLAVARHPEYSHVSDTISKLSAQGVEDPWLWTAALIVFSILIVAFAGGLLRLLPAGRMVSGALTAHGLLLAAVALLQDDLQPGGFFTVEGAAHDVVSGMAFSALIVAMVGLAGQTRLDPSWRWLRRLTLSLAVVVTAVGIAFLFTPPRLQGIPQRVFTSAGVVWIEVVAIWALRGERRRARRGDLGGWVESLQPGLKTREKGADS